MFSDPCSLSNPDFYLMKHLSLNWNINFDKNIISGKCVIDFELASNIGNENKFIVKSF